MKVFISRTTIRDDLPNGEDNGGATTKHLEVKQFQIITYEDF